MGLVFSAISEVFPPSPKFTAENVPDLTGKVIIVTGGNTGIGKETTRVLLEHNAKVYIACRSPEKAAAAVNELKASTGKTDTDLLVLAMDLADLASVKAAATEFLNKESKLDVLFNNGGVMTPPLDQLTAHGHDLQFGTNVLGHFYFTQLLLPALISTARASIDGKARVVNTSSNGHLFSKRESSGGPVDFATLRDGPARNKLGTQVAYCQSKSGNILFSQALARRYGDQGIVSTSLNPGGIRTELTRHTPKVSLWILSWLLNPVELGALTQLYAGTAPEAAELNGKYLIPWARVGPCRADHLNEKKQDELWAWLEEQVKEYAP